jgi:hypothetical protein
MFAICGLPVVRHFPDFCMQITSRNIRKGLNYLEMLHTELCRTFHMQCCIAHRPTYQTSTAFEQALLMHYADFSRPSKVMVIGNFVYVVFRVACK